MSNGPVHKAIGVAAGIGAGMLASREQAGTARAYELVGAGVGGWLGAKGPDWIDPPIHPCHRSLGHSMALAAIVWKYVVENVGRWQDTLRAKAKEHAALAERSRDPLQRLWHVLLATVCRLAAGFLVGLSAGYASHLALDFATPKCLPLLA